MNVAMILQYLFPDAVPNVDYEVWDEGGGQFIAVWNLAANQPTIADLSSAEKSAGYLAWTHDRDVARIDADTGKRINRAVHPESPIEEQLAILREQMAQFALDHGWNLTEKMARLNEIANAEIEKGDAEKAALGE